MKGKLWKDKRGISVMQDAVLFCVMVSLSGAILMPAFTSNTIQKTYIEKEKEEEVDELLSSFLSTKIDEFEYSVGETLLSDINNEITSTQIYQSLDPFVSSHKILHQPYATLLADCLASQFYLFGYRMNPLTLDYSKALRNKIDEFFESRLGDYYKYNFTARWQPIKGIPIGGVISIGSPYAAQEKFTAKTRILMPFSPLFISSDSTEVFTKESLENIINTDLTNIQLIINDYHHGLCTRDEAENSLSQDINQTIMQVYLAGMKSSSDKSFVSIVNLTIEYCFQMMESGEMDLSIVETNTVDILLKEITGERIFLNSCKESLNESLEEFSGIIAKYDGSWSEGYSYELGKTTTIDEKPRVLANYVWRLVERKINDEDLLHPYIEGLVNNLLDNENVNAREMVLNWLYDMIGLYRAEISLSIWGA